MSLTVDELLPFCQKCGGTGKLENPILKQQQNSGYGTRIVAASPVDCNECGGNGVVLTESGKALIEFFNRARSKHLIR